MPKLMHLLYSKFINTILLIIVSCSGLHIPLTRERSPGRDLEETQIPSGTPTAIHCGDSLWIGEQLKYSNIENNTGSHGHDSILFLHLYVYYNFKFHFLLLILLFTYHL